MKNSIYLQSNGNGQEAQFNLDFRLTFPVETHTKPQLSYEYTWKHLELASLVLLNKTTHPEIIILSHCPIEIKQTSDMIQCKFTGEWEFYGTRRAFAKMNSSFSKTYTYIPSHQQRYVGVFSFQNMNNLHSFCNLFTSLV